MDINTVSLNLQNWNNFWKIMKINEILNESIINVPYFYINKTMSILVQSLIDYITKFHNYDYSEVVNKFPDFNHHSLIINIPGRESFTVFNEFTAYLKDFNYPISSNAKHQVNNNNEVVTRIESTFIEDKNDSIFHVIGDNNKKAKFRFGLLSTANVVMDVIEGNRSQSKIEASLKLLKSTVKHEWGHFVQTFIFPIDQLDMKSDYSEHGVGYYTSLSELAPMLESAKGEFEVIVTDNEFWKELTRNDKMKFVKQFVGMNNDEHTITVNGQSIKLPPINPHKLFLSYRENNPTLYKKVVKKFTTMISHLLN